MTDTREEQSKCMAIPLFREDESDEEFEAKVVELKQRPKRVDSPPAYEPMVYVQIGIPAKLYDAYHKGEQTTIFDAALHEAEAKLRCTLLSRYVPRSK
jgi:hypothetical protein